MASLSPAPAVAEGRVALVEARLVWGRDTLAVRHVRPEARVLVKDLALALPASPAMVLAERDGQGSLRLVLPGGALVPVGCRMTLRVGRASLEVALVADDAPALPRARLDARWPRLALGVTLLHLAAVGVVASPWGGASRGDAVDPRVELAIMQRLVASASQRALVERVAVEERSREAPRDVPRPRPQALEVAPSRAAGAEVGPAASSLPPASPRAEAAAFGMVGLLRGRASAPPARTAFADVPVPATRPSIFDQTLDDGLSSAGEGGGGPGAGVPL
jgi:hypothetical protein